MAAGEGEKMRMLTGNMEFLREHNEMNSFLLTDFEQVIPRHTDRNKAVPYRISRDPCDVCTSC